MVQSHKFIQEFNKRAEEYFMGLRFVAETHEYFVGDKKVPKSVSAYVKSFVIPTDFAKIAQAIDRRDKLTPGTTAKAWAEKNNKACVDGSDTHDYGENREKKEYLADTQKKQAIDKFWHDLERQFPGRYFVVAKETRMYHKHFFFSGTDDVTLYDRWNDGLVIVDYKTNEDLFKNHNGNTLAAPFEFLLDCPYNHYQIQLSYYEILLMQLGYPIIERWVIWLLPTGEYKLYKTNDFVSILIEDLESKMHYA